MTNVEGEMEASSIITQVTREEDQITSFAQEKGKIPLSLHTHTNSQAEPERKMKLQL